MKKILRFAVVISIIFSMLGGNVAVLAAEVLEMQNENTAIVETPSTDTTETTPTEQSDGEVTNEKAEETTEDSAEEKTEETTNVTPEEKTEDETSTEETSNVEENTTVDQTVVEEENVIEGEEAGNTGYTTMSMNPESGPTIFEESSNKGNGRTYSLMSNLPDRDEPDGLKGSLELKIDLRLPQQKLSADSVKVTLTKEGGKAITSSEKETGKSNEKQLFYVFNDLDPSENYSLKIEGKGYQTYEASGIEVKANTTTNLEFSNGYDATAIKLDPVTGKTENLGPGVVRVGDVDGSGDVTQSDIDAILNKIEGKSSETGYNYNLNQDKDDDGNDIVDIIDLSYAAINKTSDYVTVTPRFITNLNLETVKPIEPTSGSYYSGTTDPTGKPDPTLASDITEVLASNDKHVTLQPNDTKAVISGDNPIEVGIEIEENTAEAKYINIAPSSNPNNNITDGTITVDGYDYEQDKAVELVCEIEKRPDLSRSASADLGNREKLALKVLKVYAKSENGTKADQPFKISAPPPSYEKQEGGKAYVESDGSITVDFGSQIAIKRVVIKVTGTKGNKLADIAKVEFLNGMADKIPEPQLGTPDLREQEILDSVNEDGFVVRWNNVVNVTGYKVIVRAVLKGNKEVTEIHEVDGHEFAMLTFNGGKSIKDLLSENDYGDFTKYYVSVCSTNGEWQSQPSKELEVQPRPTSKPQKVTGVNAKPGYKLIKVTWNADRRASDYFVYYRKVGDSDWTLASPTYQKDDEIVLGSDGKVIPGQTQTVEKGITETNFTISNIEGKYEVMVRARNFMGMSDDSDLATAETLAVQEVELPKYKRINLPAVDDEGNNKTGVLTQGIKGIWHSSTTGFRMNDSSLDVNEKDGTLIKDGKLYSAKGVADNSFSSYFSSADWDAGGFYDNDDKGIIVEFDKPHKMNYITIAKPQWDGSFQHATLRYRDPETQKNVRVRASLIAQRQDKDKNKYIAIKLAKPVTTDRLVIGIGGGSSINIAEMGFYEYDTIEDEINALFGDNMHLTLADNIKTSTVAEKAAAHAKVDEIEKRLTTPDEKSGEINPEADNLKKELNTASTLIDNGDLGKITKINSMVSTWYDTKSGDNDKDVEFKTSLNGWQPLGVVARGGEEITVYVGNPYKTVGETTGLQLICTQWRAEAGEWQTTLIDNLQVGANTITVPDLISTNREHGGSLYINYKGLKDDYPTRYIDREYAVRVDGGEEIPVLDLTDKEVLDEAYGNAKRVPLSEEERASRIEQYVGELETTVASLQSRHESECKTSTDKYKVQDYEDGSDCILTATEIVMNDMMYSVSSKQIWDGLTEKGYASKTDKVKGLTKSLTAMEDMMELFYNQKGLSKEGTSGAKYKDTFPRTRQNIRCMRMTGSAFMYAGGLHIGIQWNEVKDLAKGVPFKVDDQGKITGDDGNYFGWGIAHEIGHVINQKAYVHGEVTNNYFSILAQTDNTRDTVRFDYDDVYKKVTSAKAGKAQNVFTQLGLYWQLHLAYDLGGYNYKKFSTPQGQLDNSIFARMDTYARDTSRAPKKTIPLTLIDGDSDNNLIRLACAATESNLLEFFRRWGMVPNKDTINYAKQFAEEKKAIYYVNDESRNYVLEGGETIDEDNSKLSAEITNASKNRINGNQVKLHFDFETENKDGILGYEIRRCYMEKDQEVPMIAAFVEGDKTDYTDVVSTINNRVFTYKVIAYDKHLNKIGEKVLAPVKVAHDGAIDKEGWVVTTNAKSTSDKEITNDPKNKVVDTSDETQVISGVSALADNKYDAFQASTEDGSDVEIEIELPETKKLVGLKYFADQQITNYEIQVKKNVDDEWTTVKSQNSEGGNYSESETLLFTKVDAEGNNEINNYDYDTTYVKFIIHNSSINIKEIDLIGQTGDNVEFNESGSVGLNGADYVYDTEKDYKILKDSIVFTGKYKGNPAYNVVLMWYQEEGSDEWQIIDGYQVILADDPGKADLGETNDGNWVFVVDKKAMDENGGYLEENNPFYEKITSGKGKVRAELYRVDDAIKLTGERIVSDTLVIDIPQELDTITITDNRTKK